VLEVFQVSDDAAEGVVAKAIRRLARTGLSDDSTPSEVRRALVINATLLMGTTYLGGLAIFNGVRGDFLLRDWI
jgi:hypothetical protein